MNNEFQTRLVLIEPGKPQKVSGIQFESAMFTRLFIDGVDLLAEDKFDGMVIVANELEKSAHAGGHFLIFTSVCGAADDVGMGTVKVIHNSDHISWEFEIDDAMQTYQFNKASYLESVAELSLLIAQNSKKYVAQPLYVIFPE